MVRELVRGRSVKEVQSRVDYMKDKGWKPVSEIKEDPTYSYPVYVCVLQNDNKQSNSTNSGKDWGRKYHLE